ncbi:putative oxidoreductase DltE [Alicyclobacillus cellulosilyticus]|uniref:Oxidoreductase DltE n=1 Tax=Alicyclobacillus cellulosilyticus TaxID=1003997 RepID=A0A917NMA9_9BACL|nr:SDR family NAD(P)-dependent oxidoreductase [Alicyclobacillus cellulosilyticus]GGJ10802.1 putative oxidoreductase DltE [Alicyclobacillus cellulosilyticus]
MNLSGNTVLITGGATGIGLGLAAAFLRHGSKVIICGRREHKLREAQAKHPELTIRVCDVGNERDRVALYEWAVAQFPDLNVLVNNAGIQREIDFSALAEEAAEPDAEPMGGAQDAVQAAATARPAGAWQTAEQEIRINLEAPIHLTALFIPHLIRQPQAAILNVTSGLAFTPMARMPVYCATKAALHSFTLSLRHQLRHTAVKVIEVIPPMVDTELDQGARARRGQTYRGIPVDEFIQGILPGLAQGLPEVAYGTAERARTMSRAEMDEAFRRMNG